jgi:hypothetical protein
MKPYSMELRHRVLHDCDAGLPTKVVADKYTVSDSWLRKLKRRRRLTGSAARPPPADRRPAGPPTPTASAPPSRRNPTSPWRNSGPGSPFNWRCMSIGGLEDIEVVDGDWHTCPRHTQPQTCVCFIDVVVPYWTI